MITELVERLRAEKCTDFDRDWGACGRCRACNEHAAADELERLSRPQPIVTTDGLVEQLREHASDLTVMYARAVPKELLTKAIARIQSLTEAKASLERALTPFAFRSRPEAFTSTDGGCTEAIIEDADVQRARAALAHEERWRPL